MRLVAISASIACACASPHLTAQHLDGVYTVTARALGNGPACTDPGSPADPAVPYRSFVAQGNAVAFVWCDSPTSCDTVGYPNEYAPGSSSCNETCNGGNCAPLDCNGSGGGGDWTHAWANVENAPDNGVDCWLLYETLEVRTTGATAVHVDIATHTTNVAPNECTIDRALALATTDCYQVEHLDLARM